LTKWTERGITNLLEQEPEVVERAIVQLWNLYWHRSDKTVKGWGLNRFDAREGNKFIGVAVNTILKPHNMKPPGNRLFKEEYDKLRSVLNKYIRQLTKIANGECTVGFKEGTIEYDDTLPGHEAIYQEKLKIVKNQT